MTKQEQNIENSGKGKSRVEIATAARDRARTNLENCERRLTDAIEAEKANAGKTEAKAKGQRDRAIASLVKMGMDEVKAAKTVDAI